MPSVMSMLSRCRHSVHITPAHVTLAVATMSRVHATLRRSPGYFNARANASKSHAMPRSRLAVCQPPFSPPPADRSTREDCRILSGSMSEDSMMV